MKAIEVSCLCGNVRVQIAGKPVEQFYCHCDDCQTASGAPYVAVAVYPNEAVTVQGELNTLTIRNMPRKWCARCGTRMIGEVVNFDQRGVNALLLPPGEFTPAFHINCGYALLPVKDELPHYKGVPARFGGSDETVDW
jgi:hypothetical protein